MRSTVKDLRGGLYGSLLVLAYAPDRTKKERSARWLCKCLRCHNFTTTTSSHMHRNSTSCGCYARELSSLRIKGNLHTSGRDLYIIGCESWVKIGRSDNAKRRMAGIQGTCPYPLRLLRVLENKGELEHSIHSDLKDFHRLGEWYDAQVALPYMNARFPYNIGTT